MFSRVDREHVENTKPSVPDDTSEETEPDSDEVEIPEPERDPARGK